MKKYIALLSVFVIGCSTTQTQIPEEKKAKIEEIGEKNAMVLLKTLKGELIKAMSEGGAENALTVCNKKAMELTEQVEKETGVQMKRTTFKYRNPANAPDKYEKEALEYFEKSIKEGKFPKNYIQVVNENGVLTYRYYKPLKVEPVCLTCHGEVIDEKLAAKIKSLYPTDKATGYKDGDFRGVVRVSIPADKIQ